MVHFTESLRRSSTFFDNKTLILVKFFISSNLSLTHLNNPNLLKLLKLNIPCDQTFTRTILPKVFANLEQAITFKLPFPYIWTGMSGEKTNNDQPNVEIRNSCPGIDLSNINNPEANLPNDLYTQKLRSDSGELNNFGQENIRSLFDAEKHKLNKRYC